MSKITEEIIEDILDNVVHSPKRRMWKNGNMQFCCTVHNESNPSAGIKIDFEIDGKQVPYVHCFSCGFKGSIPFFIYKSLPDQFKSVKEAENFLYRRYGVRFRGSYNFEEEKAIRRYEDEVEQKKKIKILPRSFLAPFRSGKETYKYFFSRGFTKDDMKKYMIGRDIKERTITIPVFYEDGELAGVIGRFIDKRAKNARFRVYDFEKSNLLFPLDKLKVLNNTIIAVESQLDCIFIRERLGYDNCVAIMGDLLSEAQAKQIEDRCEYFIPLFDSDRGGGIARKRAKEMLKNITFLEPTYYPECGKDPLQWGEEETEKVINSAYKRKKVMRI